jgi:twinkle protein
MSEDELRRALDWAADRFFLIRADDEAPTIDWILAAAKGAVLRCGIRGLVIDPYNEIEHKKADGQNETEYVSQILNKVKRFAQAHGVHVWFVAHPAKLYRDKAGGELPVPTLYDISGSANWVNKADVGIVVHRDSDRDPTKSTANTDELQRTTAKTEYKSLKYRAKELILWNRYVFPTEAGTRI